MRRVVVTGMGIVSSIGKNLVETEYSLRHGISGITVCDEFVERGFAAIHKGSVKNFVRPHVPKETSRQWGIGNLLPMAHESADQAVRDAGLTGKELFDAGVVYGQGGGSIIDTFDVGQRTLAKGRPSVDPKSANAVTPTMASGCSAAIATHFRCGAFNYGMSAACATGNFVIGMAVRNILMGDAPTVIAGSADSTDWVLSAPFDVIRAMSREKELAPEEVSRPFDQKRAGFVMSEGAGSLVLEDLDHALARGARIYCEVAGFGISSDGKGHPTDPDRDGAMRSMLKALKRFDGTAIDAGRIGYIKAHGTSTEKGDDNELDGIHEVFKTLERPVPRIGSPKSLTGHALGGAGSIEAIFGIQMLNGGFLAKSLNIDEPSDMAKQLGLEDALLRSGEPDFEMEMFLANSFGFGGTNASLVFQRYDG